MNSASQLDFQVGQSLRERFEAGDLFVPLEDLTLIDLRGADAATVFGNMTTNHVRRLQAGQGVETFITDVRGNTFGHGVVHALADRLRLITVGGQYERLAQHIDRYVIREDVQIEDATPAVSALFWPGIEGARLTRQLDLSPSPSPQLANRAVTIDQISAEAFQVPWTRWSDWLLVVDRGQADELESALVTRDLLPTSASLLHCGRIANRFPWFGLDCTEKNLPQEMDRDAEAIDFRKGCYLGQETVARLDARGQVQKKLTLWKFDGHSVPAPGTELIAGDKVVATVTSGTFCFDHGAPLALCISRRSHFAPGSRADSPLGSAEVIAETESDLAASDLSQD